MATVVKARTPEGVKKYRLEDVRPFYLYDTITIASNNTDVDKYYFQSPSGKSAVETNLKQFSTIQIGWVFDIQKIRLIPQTNISSADAKVIFTESIITYMKEGDIEIFSLPAVMLNAGCGLAGTGTDIVSLGNPSNLSVIKLPFPLTIAGGKTFLFRQKWDTAPTPSTSVKVKMVLEGILRREVTGA